MSLETLAIGKKAEKIASIYLKNKGYLIISQNYKRKFGEIDIIGRYKNEIIFFEIKANSIAYGEEYAPQLRVNQKKLKKILKVSKFFMQYEIKEPLAYRIDIIAVTFLDNGTKARIQHFKNALQ